MINSSNCFFAIPFKFAADVFWEAQLWHMTAKEKKSLNNFPSHAELAYIHYGWRSQLYSRKCTQL